MNSRILIFLSVLIFFFSCSDIETIEVEENGVVVESFTQSKSTQLKDGLYQSFFPNGKLNEATNYKNGKINGTQIFYHKNGNESEVSNYVNDEFIGPHKKYFEDGTLELEGNYSENAMNGEWKFYYKSGKIKEVVNFKTNEEFGSFKEYHENGNIKTEGTYAGADVDTQVALEDGELKKYDEQGIHFQTMQCNKGRCKTTWLKEGVTIED